jgi:hypothetical protein
MVAEPTGTVCEAENGRKTFEPPVLCVFDDAGGVDGEVEVVEVVEVVEMV